MWDELAEEIELELTQLRELFKSFCEPMTKTQTCDPEYIELVALAGFLHSFYSGVENILKRIVIRVDGRLPSREMWHKELLTWSATPTNHRSQILSTELATGLRGFLNFRHVFRQAYTFELSWAKMEPLIERANPTLTRFEAEIRDFLQKL